EFNLASAHVKIDRWRGLEGHRPFPEAAYLRKMHMAHDLLAISARALDRGPLYRSLSGAHSSSALSHGHPRTSPMPDPAP
ncbi:MAG TPA: hypothetical protein VGH33_14950, partial [Isosphaeraceae bacterium]